MRIDDALDQVFEEFAGISNAASLGTREINFQEPYGLVVHLVRSVFIPTTSPNDGILLSRTKSKTPPKSAQVEGGLAYTKISHLERVSQPGGVDRMFMFHLNPPDGTKVGIVKVAGWIYHFTLSRTQEAIETHLITKPEFDFDTPHGAIVFSGLNLDERFTKLRVIREAIYDAAIVSYLYEMTEEDLRGLPVYSL